jgi:hypothetical protein
LLIKPKQQHEKNQNKNTGLDFIVVCCTKINKKYNHYFNGKTSLKSRSLAKMLAQTNYRQLGSNGLR